MDQVQEWCEIRHNYILANEPQLAFSIHIERYVPIYTLFDSLISWTRRRGQELPLGLWRVQKATAEADKYGIASCKSRQDLAGGSQVALQGYFCWCAGTAVLDVTCCGGHTCTPLQSISTTVHLPRALGKVPVQGQIQHLPLASDFTLLPLAALSYMWNFCRKSVIIQFERFFILHLIASPAQGALGFHLFFQMSIISLSRTFSTEFCNTMRHKYFPTASWYILHCSQILAQCNLVLY